MELSTTLAVGFGIFLITDRKLQQPKEATEESTSTPD